MEHFECNNDKCKAYMREYTIIDGDITKATDVDFIIHQVNCRGKMGSGVAKAIREKYPVVYIEYHKLCSSNIPSKLLGFTQYVQISKEITILKDDGRLIGVII